MKKNFKLAYAAVLTVGLLAVNGCKKDDDTTAPVITVAGDNPYRLQLLTPYVEPGVIAADNEDGSVAVVTDASELNIDLPGTYTVNYSATDAAGNVGTESRDVDVYANPAALARTYSVVDSCTVGTATQVYTYSQTLTVANSTQVQFNKFGDYANNTSIVATIAEDGTLTLPLQSGLNIGSSSQDHDFAGVTGASSVTATGFILKYTDKNNSSVPVSTATCKATFTR